MSTESFDELVEVALRDTFFEAPPCSGCGRKAKVMFSLGARAPDDVKCVYCGINLFPPTIEIEKERGRLTP